MAGGVLPPAPVRTSGQASRLGFERLDLLASAGDAMLASARLLDADAAFRLLIEKAPDDPRGYVGLASASDRIGDFEE